MKFFGKWGLPAGFTVLTILFALIIIVPSSVTFRKTIIDLSHNIMENIASYTIDNAEDYLRPAQKAAQLTRFLADSHIVSSEDPMPMINYFYQQIDLHPQFAGIYYGNTKGEFYMASRSDAKSENGYYTKIVTMPHGKRTVDLIWYDSAQKIVEQRSDPKDNYDPRQRPWYKDAVKANGLTWTDPYIFFTARKPGITTASPVYDKQGRLQGVVGVDISIEELSTFLAKLKLGQTGKAFILNHNCDVVAFPDLSKLQRQTEENTLRLSKISDIDNAVSRAAYKSLRLPADSMPEAQTFSAFSVQGVDYIAMFTPFKDSQWPWIIGIYIPENEFMGQVKANRLNNILISLVAVLLAGLTGLLVSRRLEAARKEAVAANQAKSRFLASISHEIRTPMNAILGAANLLRETRLDTDQRQYVQLLDNAGEGLLDLINDVLDMSKVEADLLELENIPFSPARLVEQTCSLFTLTAAGKGIELKCTVGGYIPETVMGDPVRTRQILVNLIGNAVKFTSRGRVDVGLERETPGRPGHEKLRFTVSDTGCGIPPHRLGSIFDLFTQGDSSVTRKHGGTGLGLAISKSLSAMMEGDIQVDSHQGRGSTFTFTATFGLPPQDAAVPAQEPDTDADIAPLKVLLVEDNENNRMLFTHYLKKTPHSLRTAANGELGVEAFKSFKPDIVFMDIEMPTMDGCESARRIRDWEKSTGKAPVQIVALSAHAIKGMERTILASGCTSYITKPFTRNQLLEILRRMEKAGA